MSGKKPPLPSLEQEKQWIEDLGYAGKMSIVKSATNIYNGFGYALIDGKGWLTREDAKALLTANFDYIGIDIQDAQARDKLVYQDSSGKLTYIAVVPPKQPREETLFRLW